MKKNYITAAIALGMVVSLPLPAIAENGEIRAEVRTFESLEVRDGEASLRAKARIELENDRLLREKAEMLRVREERIREELLRNSERKEEEMRRMEERGQASTTRAEERQEREEERVERKAEFRQEIAERHATNAARVITAIIERLERIIERIESRIVKIDERGGNTVEAESYLSLARENLVDAEASVNVLTELDLSGENAQEVFDKVREAAKGAKEHIRSAHTNLMMAVRNLKASVGSDDSDDDDSDDSSETEVEVETETEVEAES